jgi:DNA-directed RNA polymerase alpha subunit
MNQELFSLPIMEIKKTIKSPLITEFVFEHLENGLAVTLGNTFKRLGNQVPG